jgi:hypothetical protein
MLLQSDSDWLRIGLGDREPYGDAVPDDHLLRVAVSSFTYTAAEELWVTGRGWARFLEQLRHLVSDRHGRAVLWGADPDELQISFACDFRGAASVSGHLARHRMDGLVQRLQFGFTFPTENLTSVASELTALVG